jgi:predicted enzyme related to lactoylglutathione lyase
MPAPLIEFPADDAERARRFWHALLGAELEPREAPQGAGWEAEGDGLRLGVHERGRGPGDTASLPYFSVPDLEAAVTLVGELGGSVIHPGERWAICRDSEGNPFALSAAAPD